jgi:hypothetical protein
MQGYQLVVVLLLGSLAVSVSVIGQRLDAIITLLEGLQ